MANDDAGPPVAALPHPLSHTSTTFTSESRPQRLRYGSEQHVVYHSECEGAESKALRIRDLVRPPVMRQWIEGGKIYREAEAREVPRVELFFDLLFAAEIHLLADAAIEEAGGDAVARFVLTFWPSWSIWEEARKYSNQSGQDDFVHRAWVLIGMICILGYAANASAIELHPSEDADELDHVAIRAAVAFWLIIKLTRVIVLWIYAWRLPRFRISEALNGFAVLLPMLVYLPLIWVTSRPAQIAIATAAMILDMVRFDLVGLYIYGHVHHARNKRAMAERGEKVEPTPFYRMSPLPKTMRVPAMNIEHAIDRNADFVVIVLGELVLNLLFKAGPGTLGASLQFGRAVLGLMTAWALNYLYLLPSHPNNEYEHGLRRSMLSGMLFTWLHWPLCASLVLTSAAAGRMVTSAEVEISVVWYWGCGLGFAVLSMLLIDINHKNLAPLWDSRIPRPFRHAIIFVGALALILYPLGAEGLSTVANLAIGVAITWTLLAVQVIGILPRPEAWPKAAERRKSQRSAPMTEKQREVDRDTPVGPGGADQEVML